MHDLLQCLHIGAGRVVGPGGELEELTARERDVLAAMAEGLSNHAIAGRTQGRGELDRLVDIAAINIFSWLGLAAATDAHRRVLAVLAYLRAPPAPAG